MYRSEYRTFLFSGMSTPAIRGIFLLRVGFYLTLPSLKSRVFLIDDISLAFSNDDLAIFCTSFNAAFYFHSFNLLVPKGNQCLYVIRPFVMSYGLISTDTLSPGRIRM